MDLFDLMVKVSLDSTDFNKGVAAAKQNLNTLSSNLKSFSSGLDTIGTKFISAGKTLTMAITAPVVGLGVYAAKTAVEFLQLKENTKVAFEVLLGSGEKAEQMLKDLYDFAQGTPISYQSYLEAGKQLVAMGIAAENVIPYLDKMTNAAIATGKGQMGLDTLATAIGRMSSRGKIQLEDLNRMIEMGIPAVKILGNAYGKTEEQIFLMMKGGELLSSKALPKLMEGMENGTKGVNGMTAAYGGLAAKMEGTLTGALDTVRARWRDFTVKLFDAQNAYPILTKLIENFAAAIQKLPRAFEAFTKKVTPFLDLVNKKLEQFSAWVEKASDEDLSRLIMAIGALVALGPALIVLGGAFKALSIAIGAVSFLVSPTGLIVLGIAALAAGFIYLWKTSESFRNFWIKLWDIISTAFTSFLEKTGILEVFQRIGEQAKELWGKLSQLKDFFIVLGTVLGALLAPAFAAVAGTVTGLIKAFESVMVFVNGIIDVLTGFGKIIVGIFTFDGEKIKDGFKTLWEGIKKIFTGGFSAIWGYLEGYINGAVSFLSSTINTLLEKLGIKEALNKIKDAISTWFDKTKTTINDKLKKWDTSITTWFNKANESISNKLGEWKTTMSNWFTEKKDTLSNGFQTWWSGVESWFNDIKDKISAKFEEIKKEVKKIMDDPNYLIELIDGWTNSLNEWSYGKINAFKLTLEEWKKKISEWFKEKKDTFVEGFKSWWAGVEKWFNELPQGLKVAMGSLLSPILLFFPQSWEKISAWFNEKKEEFPKKFEEWKKGISDWFTEKKDTIVNGFKNWWESVGTWFTETKESIPVKFEEWKKKISDWFTEKKDTFVNGIQTWWDSVGEWIKKTKEDIPKKFEEWKTTIFEWFKNLGKDNVEKMGEGIDEKTKEPDFLLKLGRTIIKFIGAIIVAAAVGLIAVGYSLVVDYIWPGMQKGWNWVTTEFPKLVGSIGAKVGEKLDEVWKTISKWIEKIKGLFNFSWSLPNIKMPHFKISGSFSLNPLSVPTIGVDWYAKGGILNNPTLFGFNPFSGNAMIGGEAGAEAIAPIDTLKNYVKESVQEANRTDSNKETLDGIVNLLKTYLPGIANMQIALDGGTLVGALVEPMDNSLGVRNALKARGNA